MNVKKELKKVRWEVRSIFMAQNGNLLQNVNLSRSYVNNPQSQVQQTEEIKSRIGLQRRLSAPKNVNNFAHTTQATTSREILTVAQVAVL